MNSVQQQKEIGEKQFMSRVFAAHAKHIPVNAKIFV